MNTKFNQYLGFFGVFLLFSCAGHPPPSNLKQGGFRLGKTETGYASWYGSDFHGKKTASGEIYNMNAKTAAHRVAPFGTTVRVTNLQNSRQTQVVINDRGPFIRGRIIDLSKAAAQDIGLISTGTAKVKIEYLHVQPKSATTFIQLASFESSQNAEQFLQVFQRETSGITARIYSENGFHRVRAGPYDQDGKALSDLNQLKKLGYNGFILHP